MLRVVQLDSPFLVHSNTFFQSLGALRCSFLLALLLTCAFAPAAKADFVSPYSLRDFTLLNSTPSDNGTAVTPDGGRTVVLTGPNDGSGLPGFTELTVLSQGTGLFRFDYVYTSLDTPNADSAGYILNGRVFPLAAASGQSGTVSVPVRPGDRIGFRIDTVDNIAEPGVLTISNFSAPSATPTTVPTISTAAALVLAVLLCCSGLLLLKRGALV
jgi:hypothetical protein